jgi:hypothetical protein
VLEFAVTIELWMFERHVRGCSDVRL